MKTGRIISVTIKSLKSHIFRAILASIGVVLGVGSVVGMMSISEGARVTSLKEISQMGINNIILSSEEIKKASKKNQDSRIVSFGINKQDLNYFQNFENINTIVPLRDLKKKVNFRDRNTGIGLYATEPDFINVTNCSLVGKKSRLLTWEDENKLRKVCLIGQQAAKTLFQYHDPIGKEVSIGLNSFTVVGVFENQYGFEASDNKSINNQILIPFQTANAVYGNRILDTSVWKYYETYCHKAIIKVKENKYLSNTATRIRNYLKRTHEEKDYSITVPLELVKQKEKTQKIFTIVMGSIAAISLLVGGIGIMNIMLANIYERTREIGTRRALGATQKDIVLQFLSESVLMTGIGGGLGVAVGVAIARLVETYGNMTTVVSAFSLILSFSVAVGTGIVFGTYPAYQASKLDPVVALRRE